MWDGRAERHSAVQRSPRSHSSASLRSRSAVALSSCASLRYRIALALLIASQIPRNRRRIQLQEKDLVPGSAGEPGRAAGFVVRSQPAPGSPRTPRRRWSISSTRSAPARRSRRRSGRRRATWSIDGGATAERRQGGGVGKGRQASQEVAQGRERPEGNADADRRQEAGEGDDREQACGKAAAQVGLDAAR